MRKTVLMVEVRTERCAHESWKPDWVYGCVWEGSTWIESWGWVQSQTCSMQPPPRHTHIYWYHRLCLTRALLAVLTSNKKWVKNTEGSSPDVLMTAVCWARIKIPIVCRCERPLMFWLEVIYSSCFRTAENRSDFHGKLWGQIWTWLILSHRDFLFGITWHEQSRPSVRPSLQADNCVQSSVFFTRVYYIYLYIKIISMKIFNY